MGAEHPVIRIMNEVVSVFRAMGYSVGEGPEVETDYYNFDALNIPEGHPARESQDTFYTTEGFALRSQTSTVQIRVMESTPPPVRIGTPA